VSDDFRRRVPIEEIARSVWNSKRGTGGAAAGAAGGGVKTGGTLSVLSDDSFISACDEFVSLDEVTMQGRRESVEKIQYKTFKYGIHGLLDFCCLAIFHLYRYLIIEATKASFYF
jgi:hypothetical protein